MEILDMLISVLALIALEVVLGIDNIILASYSRSAEQWKRRRRYT